MIQATPRRLATLVFLVLASAAFVHAQTMMYDLVDGVPTSETTAGGSGEQVYLFTLAKDEVCHEFNVTLTPTSAGNANVDLFVVPPGHTYRAMSGGAGYVSSRLGAEVDSVIIKPTSSHFRTGQWMVGVRCLADRGCDPGATYDVVATKAPSPLLPTSMTEQALAIGAEDTVSLAVCVPTRCADLHVNVTKFSGDDVTMLSGFHPIPDAMTSWGLAMEPAPNTVLGSDIDFYIGQFRAGAYYFGLGCYAQMGCATPPSILFSFSYTPHASCPVLSRPVVTNRDDDDDDNDSLRASMPEWALTLVIVSSAFIVIAGLATIVGTSVSESATPPSLSNAAQSFGTLSGVGAAANAPEDATGGIEAPEDAPDAEAVRQVDTPVSELPLEPESPSTPPATAV